MSAAREHLVGKLTYQAGMDDDERTAMEQTIEEAGNRATSEAPFAWLRMEPSDHPLSDTDVRLKTWPDGEDRLIARSGYHGTAVQWLGG